jgi:hypothetical protein
MLRFRVNASSRNSRSLIARFRTQEVVTPPMTAREVQNGSVPKELWRAGSVDIEYDADPTAKADPVDSWSQTVTVSLFLRACLPVAWIE